ncbi:MAG: hypothetical protein GKR86_14075 [Ilumatobacter sp.]|nr:hypothetical protein [bacterium]NKB42136.1 hypothetical protein [Ilumatobacter sp.]
MIVCPNDDLRRPIGAAGINPGSTRADIMRFSGAWVAADGTDPQSRYRSLGYFIRDMLEEGLFFGDVQFTGAHCDSVHAVTNGTVDLTAIDVRSWWLACDYEPSTAGRLAVIGTTDPTPGVVCVVS